MDEHEGDGGQPAVQPPGAPSGRPASGGEPAARSLRHELRTPLNQILGYAELLQETAVEDGRSAYVPDLQRIVAAGRRLLELIDSIGGTAPSERAVKQPSEAGATSREPTGPTISGGAARPGIEPGRFSLLVVDDNELNRDMLSRRLAARGYGVRTAADGRSALELLASGRFDLVLLDVMMPGVNGLEVLGTLRRTRSVADLPVIMVTARDQSEDTVEALRLGANDYVTKPIDFPVALARIETQLSLRSAGEEVRRLAVELEKRNRFIRQTFGRYLTNEVVASLLETPEGLRLGGERRTVTILLSDLRGFTPLAERLTPEQVVRILNNYLGAMADVVCRFQGTVDEFIGDSVLALFGAPTMREDDARRAVACALAMQKAMTEVNARNREAGLPAVQMGIALNTGEVVVGNIGSERRSKYGVVGSPVNLTARMQASTLGGQVLISEGTLASAGAGLVVGERRLIAAKGFDGPVAVYELRSLGTPSDPPSGDHAD